MTRPGIGEAASPTTGAGTSLPKATNGRPAAPQLRAILLTATAFLLLMILAVQLYRRIQFPWDLYMWSESPFLTNMLKLRNGAGIYTSPADGNSFLYAPGLELLCHLILSPFELDLDIRACRWVSASLCFLTAWIASTLGVRFLGPEERPWFRPFCFAATTLLLFKEFTADVCHPDNLHIFHATVALALCVAAADRNKIVIAVVAAAWSAFGVATKQTGAFGLIGVLASLLIVWRDAVSRALIVGTGIAAMSTTLALLLRGFGRFYLFEVPFSQPIYFFKIAWLASQVFSFPSLLMPIVILPAIALLRRRTLIAQSRVMIPWMLIGAFEVAPSVMGFFKMGGGSNNLRIISLWLLIPSLPILWSLAISGRSWRSPASLAIAIALLASEFPTHMPPSARHYEFGRELEAELRRDREGGRTVLLSHATAPLIRAGFVGVPLDRLLSFGELAWAGLNDEAGFQARIRAGYYDRLYLVSFWSFYNETSRALIEANYRQIGLVKGYMARGKPSFWDPDFDFVQGTPRGYQFGLMGDVRVMERRRQ